MPLAPPGAELPEEVDVLIVGSGFGGSVMAAELAAAKRKNKDGTHARICLLERGRAYPPGSFPRDPAGVSRNFWDPNAKLYGMFHVVSFAKMDVVVSSGLGGGSLIYANVMLRKDANWFKQHVPGSTTVTERWMLTAGDLEKHYEEIIKFLKVQELPHAEVDPPEFRLAKTSRFLQNAAQDLLPTIATNVPASLNATVAEFSELPAFEDTAGYAPLAVRFRVDGIDSPAAVGAPLVPEPYGSLYGDIHRTTCTLIGECDVGCNQGAKNTLDHTYLSQAFENDVTIYTLSEAIGLQHDSDADYPFTVTVQRHHPLPEDHGVATVGEQPQEYPPIRASEIPDTAQIKARRVVLAAGTLGTTTLLLRHADRLNISSSALGSRFSGNGDFLTFVHNVKGRLDPTRGPVITAYRRYPAETDAPDPPGTPDPGKDGRGDYRHGMYIEDAGYPAFAAWLVQLGQAGTMTKNAFRVWLDRKFPSNAPGRQDDRANMSAELHAILTEGAFSSKAMPLLGMGRDVPSGRFSLDGMRNLQCDWNAGPSKGYYDTMINRMRTIAERFGGSLFVNPLYSRAQRGITVHPVGGCPMDTTSAEGVVDSFGRVRRLPGLRVCDGSVFPGPIGPNPSLTIAAFARRCAHHLLEEDWQSAPGDVDEYDPGTWESKNPEPELPRGRVLAEHIDLH